PANIDVNVAALLPAQLLQPLAEGCYACVAFRVILAKTAQHTDASHTISLLGPRRERPRRRRAAEQRDELATLHHSITSSARPNVLTSYCGLMLWSQQPSPNDRRAFPRRKPPVSKFSSSIFVARRPIPRPIPQIKEPRLRRAAMEAIICQPARLNKL